MTADVREVVSPPSSGRTVSDFAPRPAGAARTVVVIGGGFSGAVVAHQLARRAPDLFRIVVIEPRERLGSGVAYSTTDPAHRINVPASRMSFVSSDPCHFDRWLKADGVLRSDPEALTPDGRAFPRREVFGRYVAETLEPYLLTGAIEHRRDRATTVVRAPWGGYVVRLASGGEITADDVVLAATHPSPAAPEAFSPVAGDPRLIADTQDAAALDALDPDARVLIVGTGLSMADIVASLERRGHRGPITAVSRRGLLSRGHPSRAADEYGAFDREPSVTALDLLQRIRRTVAAAEASGGRWHYVLDAVRNQGRGIWAALPESERRKVARRLRTFWDVHRFRVAPQLEDAIARLRASGQFEVFAGEPVSAEVGAGGIEVSIQPRRGALRTETFDAVALATGPAHRGICASDPLMAALADQGFVTPDRLGLGLSVDETSRAIGREGASADSFWIAGPLARGTFGELMGLPEVPRHAEFVACGIVKAAAAAAREARAAA